MTHRGSRDIGPSQTMTSTGSFGQDHLVRSQRLMVDSFPHTPVGLPARAWACLFDLDGVPTDTARLHEAGWKEMFDGYLTARAEETGTPFVAFDGVADYDTYVDDKSRADGIRSLLQSRGIDMPTDARSVGDAALGITGLGDAKNAIFIRTIRRTGVDPYPGSARYVRTVQSAGLYTAVVSSGANCAEVDSRVSGSADDPGTPERRSMTRAPEALAHDTAKRCGVHCLTETSSLVDMVDLGPESIFSRAQA